ncbi:SLOG family protein [Oscillospiraceae bacterium 38-13]
MREKTCCFTGHREIPPEERAGIADRLEHIIISLYQQGIQTYEAGGALGFDTLASQVVLRLRESCPGMKLILVLPCLTQTRGWRPEDVTEYERIKAQADHVIYTAQQYTRGCMHRRNRHLVDHSGVCVCYLTRDSGGTAYTVQYAEKQGLEIINIA